MLRTNIILLAVYSFALLIISCSQLSQKKNKEEKFAIVDLQIKPEGVLNIQNCAKWYIDFNEIKKTVLYNGKIICCGLNGGFICLNESDFKQDTSLERKMNTDFFTNIAVFRDTLFTEKFNQLFYWDTGKWMEYKTHLPIKYFNLHYEDAKYAVYSTCGGEFGSILFYYNKQNGLTRAKTTSCPNSVLKTDSGFYVATHLYHMTGSSNTYFIKDIEKLKAVPDSIRFFNGMVDRDTRISFLNEATRSAPDNYSYTRFTFPGKKMMIVASFMRNGTMYHIVDPREFNRKQELRLIATVMNDTLRVVDSMYDSSPQEAYQFGKSTVLKDVCAKNSFCLIRNDTIFKVRYSTRHTGYNGPKFENYNLQTDLSDKPTAFKEYTLNGTSHEYSSPAPGKAEREIEFSFDNKYKVAGFYGNGINANYIYKNSERMKLKFADECNYLKNIFISNDRYFLFFGNLGGVNHKYGLIEITDMETFIAKYRAD